ncbi:nitroreductase family protein [Lactobacillus porci]|uniref:nitroreductase family protein n=1 Tax=Lactobacillus porci TaxID=2012477 RepID=UPI00399106AC
MENPILRRTAIRKYTDEAVSTEDVEQLVAAFQAAPCGMHEAAVMQACVVTKPELAKRVEEAIGGAGYGAPVLFLISTKHGSPFGERDASAAAENVMIQAADLGLGSVYVMSGALRLNDSPALKQELGIDDGFDTVVLVAIGHPGEAGKNEDRSKRYKVVRN